MDGTDTVLLTAHMVDRIIHTKNAGIGYVVESFGIR